MSRIFDGVKFSNLIKNKIKQEVQLANSRPPSLHILTCGDDPASDSFIKKKGDFAKDCGIHVNVHKLNNSPKYSFVRHIIQELNDNPNIDGILIQLPFSVENRPYWEVSNLVDPKKDVDGLHFANVSRLSRGLIELENPLLAQDFYLSAAPLAFDEVTRSIELPRRGIRAAVVGDGPLVGNPVSDLLTYYCQATVTRCNEFTRDLEGIIRESELIVTGVGKPHLIKGEWIKDGAVIIDYGISLAEENKKKLLGDVEFEKAAEKARMITPVPGGMGPVTVAMLMMNVMKSYKLRPYTHL